MKASDSYPSLVQGVSQQAPETRGPGRMAEQVNMIPDPVYGLTRRHGTVFLADKDTGMTDLVAATNETASYRTLVLNNGTHDIDLMYRSGPRTALIPPVFAYNRSTNAFLTYVRNVTDVNLDIWEASGTSAITALGKYVFTAAAGYPVTSSTTAKWEDVSLAAKSAVWIRGGSYSRTFNITATDSLGTDYSVSYTTPQAAYPGELNTAAVPAFTQYPAGGTDTETELVYVTKKEVAPPWGVDSYYYSTDLAYGQWGPAVTAVSLSTRTAGTVTTTAMTNTYPAAPTLATHYYWAAGDRTVYFFKEPWDTFALEDRWATVTYTHTKVVANENYTRIITDLTSAYNTAVTQWISSAAAAIQAEAIALEINNRFITAGLTTGHLRGSHILWDNVTALTVSDSGDGSLIRGVAQTVKSIADLTDWHWPNKVVRIQATANAESYYVRAVAKSDFLPDEVSWVESGSTLRQITSGLIYLYTTATHVYAASSSVLLNAIIPGDHPTWVPNQIGDSVSNPMPSFVGKAIDFLGVFQDRLIVGSGSTLSFSRTGDYLNFMRSTVVTVPANDAFSMRAEGPEDDTIRFSAIYNRDLIAFGKKRQYLVAGRTALTPTAASMPIVSNHADTTGCPPIDTGGYIFYASTAADRSSISQIEPTVNIDSPAAFPASSQLDDYITGEMIEMMNGSKPLTLYCRSNGARDTIFAFQYVDSSQGRRQDAWYKWKFNSALGPLTGIAYKDARMILYFLRPDAGTLWLVADEVDLTSGLSTKPYMDSLRILSSVGLPGHTLAEVPEEPWGAAYDNTSVYFLQGRANASDASLLSTAFPSAPSASRWVGCQFDAYTTLTNPYMKDKNDVAITSGVLTVSTMAVVVTNSSGLTYTVTDRNGAETYTLNGRVLGDTVVGRIPVTTGALDLNVYADNTEYTLTLAANTWLPLTISSIDWVGQFFNRTARR